jgi:hypothetical protein
MFIASTGQSREKSETYVMTYDYVQELKASCK